jgi:hypothetical protein
MEYTSCESVGVSTKPGQLQYIDPPAHAVVLSVDEKSQIQTLDRTQPGLPLKCGRCGTMTHDYKRNDTTTLFAALDVTAGRVNGRRMQHHRRQEFIRLLNAIEREGPAGELIHVILDNYAAHKHPKVIGWARPPPALHLPLHADFGLLAERRRGLLRQTHKPAAQARFSVLSAVWHSPASPPDAAARGCACSHSVPESRLSREPAS